MESSTSNGLGKLLPKSLTAKRRLKQRRKQARDDADAADNDDDARGRRLSSRDPSDDGNSTNMADDEDVDGHSFGSYGSSADISQAHDYQQHPHQQHQDSPSFASHPPTRPNTLSAHPSLIGYLTTASPEVQATHLTSQTRSPEPSFSTADRRTSITGVSPIRASEASDIAPGPPILEAPAAAKIAPSGKGSRAPPRIETVPPRTPPKGDRPAPAIVNTPPTPTELQSFGSASPERKLPWNTSNPVAGADGGATSYNMNAHRRTKSGSASIGPSKLSNITLAPLTPTAEAGETTPSATGFFSSMISAAQNAANTFSSNIPGNAGMNIGGTKSRTSLPKAQGSPATSQVEIMPPPEPRIEEAMDQKQSAVRTLGAGELSLSQLGLAEPTSSVASPASQRFPDLTDTRARSESAPVDGQIRNGEFLAEESSSRPRSLIESHSGDQTPPPLELVDTKAGMHRSSSMRSAIRPHRKRGSSVTTGTTIGAAIAAANSSVGHPSGGFGAPKLTGFAIASKKRNRDFHNFFKSVPDDDYLIEDYSCALQREILAHGRLYVSEGHLCFSSNILGWTTTLVMSFDEIVSVEKRSTALLFKNGLMISTLHAKHVFASFTGRDATYDLIVNIWKLGHPTLTSTLNGVRLEGTGGDKTEKVGADPIGEEGETQVVSESEEDSDEDDEDFYDEDDTDGVPETQLTDPSGMGGASEKPASRKVSMVTATNGSPTDPAKDASSQPAGAADFPGPATHPPTDCGDSATHYDTGVDDDIVPAPLGKVYSLLFGQASSTWMAKWLAEDQKCTELQMEDKKGLSLQSRNRNYTYIKPLGGGFGPKQTKCVVSETLDSLDFEKAVNVSVSTQNPDVPSGNVFCVKTKYCLSWAENNATRVQVNWTTEWSGKSWVKGLVEKGVNDGQSLYCKELVAGLKVAVSSRPRASGATNYGTARSKKKGKKNKALQSAEDSVAGNARPKHAAKQNWGILEPVRSLVEPCLDIIQPVFTGNVMYGLLVGLLVATWFGFGFTPTKNTGDLGIYSPQRLAAYEEMWRREDTELWDWLEERVGLDRLSTDGSNARKKTMEPRTVEERLREERMDEREVEEAIRVTEERLKVLKGVVGKTNAH